MNTKNLEVIKSLRHELHSNPELSMQETWTKQCLINFLKTRTKLTIVDKGTWFYAVYNASPCKRNIAFRADYDALPMEEGLDLPYASKYTGAAHKCGHDGHAASLVAFALEIDQIGADKNIYFLFQPGEETGEGGPIASSLIKDHQIDEIFAYHNWPSIPLKAIAVIDGTAHYASKGITIHMEGTPSHASEPEKGKNPAYAICKIVDLIPKLVNSEKNSDMLLCTIIQVDIGEKAFGVSASKGNLLLTIRALHEDDMNKLQKCIITIAEEQAEKYGLKVSFSYHDEFPETVNDMTSNNKIRRICQEKGYELIELHNANRCSEDFGCYLKLTKGAICYIGNGELSPALHTFEYDFNDEIIETAVELFKGLAAL